MLKVDPVDVLFMFLRAYESRFKFVPLNVDERSPIRLYLNMFQGLVTRYLATYGRNLDGQWWSRLWICGEQVIANTP